MEAQELDGLKVEGIGRVHLQSDVRASIKADNKAAAYEWLGDNGHGGLITETVNASSLKAFCKDKMKNGEELPRRTFSKLAYSHAL